MSCNLKCLLMLPITQINNQLSGSMRVFHPSATSNWRCGSAKHPGSQFFPHHLKYLDSEINIWLFESSACYGWKQSLWRQRGETKTVNACKPETTSWKVLKKLHIFGDNAISVGLPLWTQPFDQLLKGRLRGVQLWLHYCWRDTEKRTL